MTHLVYSPFTLATSISCQHHPPQLSPRFWRYSVGRCIAQEISLATFSSLEGMWDWRYRHRIKNTYIHDQHTGRAIYRHPTSRQTSEPLWRGSWVLWWGRRIMRENGYAITTSHLLIAFDEGVSDASLLLRILPLTTSQWGCCYAPCLFSHGC